MPTQATRTHEPPTETSTQVAPPEKKSDTPTSNAEEQEKLRGKEGTETGLENYQAALTKWLGGELYQAIAPHLTFEALQGYANDGLTAAIEGGVGQLGSLGGEDNKGTIDKGAIKKFGTALAQQYGDVAGDLLDSEVGHKITAGLADWVDANPRLIVLTGLLAAAGAILADMDVPTIKQKFGIVDGLDAEIEAELGSLRNLALEEIKTTLSYSTGPLLAAVQVDHKGATEDSEGGQSYKASIGLSEKDTYNIKADVEFTNDGFKAYGASGMLQTDAGKLEGGIKQQAEKDPVITGKITNVDGSTTVTNAVEYDANSGVFSFKNGVNEKLDNGGSLSTNMGIGTDGSQQVGFSAKGKVSDNLTAKGGFQHTTTAKDGALTDKQTANFGLDYKNEQNTLNASLDSKYNFDGSGSVSGKGMWKPSDNLKLNAFGEYGFGETTSYKLGAGLDYQDERNRFMANTSYNSKNSQFDANLLAQRRLTDDFALRGTAGFRSNDKGNQYNLGMHGAYFVNDDVALIGGGKYQVDQQGQSAFIPEVGAQVKGIPLTVGYNTQTKGWVVGATLRF